MMLHSTPQARQVLVKYVQELRANPNPAPLAPRLASAFLAPENALQTHLVELDRQAHNSTARR
jgi:hypothetical protein